MGAVTLIDNPSSEELGLGVRPALSTQQVRRQPGCHSRVPCQKQIQKTHKHDVFTVCVPSSLAGRNLVNKNLIKFKL